MKVKVKVTLREIQMAIETRSSWWVVLLVG